MAVVMNNEFRDMAAQANFPLAEDSTLAQGEIVLDAGMLLDALLYPVLPRTAPYRISVLDGNGDGSTLRMTLADAGSLEVGTVECSVAVDHAMVVDTSGRVVGVLVYNPALLSELLGKVGRTRVELGVNVAQFTMGACFSPRPEGMLYLSAGGQMLHGDVVLCAAGGVHFERESPVPPVESSSLSSRSGTSSVSSESESSGSSSSSSRSGTSSASSSSETLSSGTISVNIYGEMYTQAQPILTLNGYSMQHGWLAAHQDESAIRIQTSPDEHILIGKAKDFGYAT